MNEELIINISILARQENGWFWRWCEILSNL